MLSEISLRYQNMSILDYSLQLAEEMWLLWAWETYAKKTEAMILFGTLTDTTLVSMCISELKLWPSKRERRGRGWHGYIASLTQWTWIWANSGRLWRTEEPGMLQFTGSQRVGHDLETEQQQPSQFANWRNRADCLWELFLVQHCNFEIQQKHRMGIHTAISLWKAALWPLYAKLLQLCLTLSDSMDCSPEEPRLFCPQDSPDKNTGVGCCALCHGDPPQRGIEPLSYVSGTGSRVFYH